jgi:membrane-associated phospholipid phosphatase
VITEILVKFLGRSSRARPGVRERAALGDATVAAGAAAVLAAVARLVARGQTRDLDQQWAGRIGASRGLADHLSYLAQPRMVVLETAAAALLPRLRGNERVAIISGPLLAGLVGHALKLLVPRDRPGVARFRPLGDQSFPSTHAAHATALAMAAARAARRHGAGPWVHAAAGAVIATIGLARIRASAHWPTDVLAGSLLGVAAARAAQLLMPPPVRFSGTARRR